MKTNSLEEVKEGLKILQEAFNKMRIRQNYLEDRLEKIDKIKTRRPNLGIDNGLPIA